MDRVLALRGHMSERFLRSNRPGYPHPASSELENSGIRVAVGDCSVTECRRWRPPYQTSKTVHVHAKQYKHNEDRRRVYAATVPYCWLSHSGNAVTRIGIHTQLNLQNSIDLDEVAHNEPPHLDLHCLPSQYLNSLYIL